jgi:outer membrane protein
VKRQLFALLAASAAALLAAPALAQQNVIKVGGIYIDPKGDVPPLQTVPPGLLGPNATASLSSTATAIFAYERLLNDNWSLEIAAGLPPKYKLDGAGSLAPIGELGTLKQYTASLIARYYFLDKDNWVRPHVGAGPAYTRYSASPSSGLQAQIGPTSASATDDWGLLAAAGLAFKLSDNWGLDAAFNWLRVSTTVTLDAPLFRVPVGGSLVSLPLRATTDARVDLYTLSLTLTYRF